MAVYTSRAEVERLMGRAGAASFLDDNRDGIFEPGVIDDCIEDASTQVDLYLERFYDTSDMASNRWVRRITTWIAAFIISQRRGNAALFQSRYNQIMEWLTAIARGTMQAPGLPWKADLSPALSNMVVDDRFMIAKARVQPSVSTGGIYSKQHRDPAQGFEVL